MSTPTNTDDIIDSRDIIAHLEELRSERQDLVDAVEKAEEALADLDDEATDADKENAHAAVDLAREALAEWDTENKAELDALEAVNTEGEDYAGDWTDGEAMIRESHWQDWVQQYAEDTGCIPEGSKWPLTCIDWEQAAKELAYDYATITFDGVDYYVRS